MKIFKLLIVLTCLFLAVTSVALCQPINNGVLVDEPDGSPNGFAYKLRFPNGTVTLANGIAGYTPTSTQIAPISIYKADGVTLIGYIADEAFSYTMPTLTIKDSSGGDTLTFTEAAGWDFYTPITLEDTIPTINFIDTDGDDNDVNGKILYNLTTTTTNAEVGDFKLQSMAAQGSPGVMQDAFWFDGSERTFWLYGKIGFLLNQVTAEGPTDDYNVGGFNILTINSVMNNVTIGGFVGGVAGQVLHIVVINPANDATLEHAEGTGNQDIYLSSGADETIPAGRYGGWTLVCTGAHWYEVDPISDIIGAGTITSNTNSYTLNTAGAEAIALTVTGDLATQGTRFLTVKASAVDYTPSVLTDDSVVILTTSGSAIGYTISTEDIQSGSSTLRRVITVMDGSNNAGTNNITIGVETGTINGAATATISTDNGAAVVFCDGTNCIAPGAD